MQIVKNFTLNNLVCVIYCVFFATNAGWVGIIERLSFTQILTWNRKLGVLRKQSYGWGIDKKYGHPYIHTNISLEVDMDNLNILTHRRNFSK
jgi:hypothetical protein